MEREKLEKENERERRHDDGRKEMIKKEGMRERERIWRGEKMNEIRSSQLFKELHKKNNSIEGDSRRKFILVDQISNSTFFKFLKILYPKVSSLESFHFRHG